MAIAASPIFVENCPLIFSFPIKGCLIFLDVVALTPKAIESEPRAAAL